MRIAAMSSAVLRCAPSLQCPGIRLVSSLLQHPPPPLQRPFNHHGNRAPGSVLGPRPLPAPGPGPGLLTNCSASPTRNIHRPRHLFYNLRNPHCSCYCFLSRNFSSNLLAMTTGPAASVTTTATTTATTISTLTNGSATSNGTIAGGAPAVVSPASSPASSPPPPPPPPPAAAPGDGSDDDDATATLPQICAQVHAQIECFLAAPARSELAAQVQAQTRASLAVMRQALDTYSSVFPSFLRYTWLTRDQAGRTGAVVQRRQGLPGPAAAVSVVPAPTPPAPPRNNRQDPQRVRNLDRPVRRGGRLRDRLHGPLRAGRAPLCAAHEGGLRRSPSRLPAHPRRFCRHAPRRPARRPPLAL